MSAVATSHFLDVIAVLPDGSALRMDEVSWDEYKQLLADLGDGYAVRIFYDRGRMEIMAPTPMHEKSKNILHRLVMTMSDELDVDIESLGSTTFKDELYEKGAEPDDCFYVQNVALVLGREDLTIQSVPPPDLVIESDFTSSSLNRFAIYAALGVTEIWRIHKQEVRIHVLEQTAYAESVSSRVFPFLSAATLSQFLSLGMKEGGRKAAKALRHWLREQHSANG